MKRKTLQNIIQATLLIVFLVGLTSWELSAELKHHFPINSQNLWQTLLKVTWTKKYDNTHKAEIEFPTFSPEVKALERKSITISGYLLPTDLYSGDDYVILSAYPMSQCYFCGGAGAESVMEIYVRNGRKTFATERLTFKGTLELNYDDTTHLIYKLKDAVLSFNED